MILHALVQDMYSAHIVEEILFSKLVEKIELVYYSMDMPVGGVSVNCVASKVLITRH